MFYKQKAILWDLSNLYPISTFKGVGDSVYDQFRSDLSDAGYQEFFSLSSNTAIKFWTMESEEETRR